eukprot:m.125166 g.125166  ORF g.125166 m.125166 type:complete len:508 (+) comp29111_c0_seq2:189-1712(+)
MATSKVEDEVEDDKDATTITEALAMVGHGWAQYRLGIIVGLVFMSDSIEVMMLSFLHVKAGEEFGLSPVEESLLSSVVFAGELIGALMWGPVADKFGRRITSILIALFVALMGVGSAFSYNFEMLVVLRALVGVGIGGASVPFDVLAEFVQPKHRGSMLMFIEFFWCAGSVFVAGLAWGALEEYKWRWFVGFCSCPVLLSLIAFIFMPESPYWLLSQGREKAALETLKHAAAINGRPSALNTVTKLVVGGGGGGGSEGRSGGHGGTSEGNDYLLLGDHPTTSATPLLKNERAIANNKNTDNNDDSNKVAPPSPSPFQMFNRSMRLNTLRLFLVWFLFGFNYYGVVLILPEVLESGEEDEYFDYQALFVSSLAEFVGCTVAYFLIDRVGRTRLSGVAYMGAGAAMAVLIYTGFSNDVNVTITMIARACIFVASATTWVMTPELFPTTVRAAGHSWCNAAARIGAAITPFWGNAATLSRELRVGVYGGSTIFVGILSLTIAETRNTNLR